MQCQLFWTDRYQRLHVTFTRPSLRNPTHAHKPRATGNDSLWPNTGPVLALIISLERSIISLSECNVASTKFNCSNDHKASVRHYRSRELWNNGSLEELPQENVGSKVYVLQLVLLCRSSWADGVLWNLGHGAESTAPIPSHESEVDYRDRAHYADVNG